MPNLIVAERHRASMTRIERQFLNSALAEYEELRRDLRSLALDLGLDSPQLAGAWRGRLLTFRQRLEGLARGILATVQNEAMRFASNSLDGLRDLVDLPPFSDLFNDSVIDRQVAQNIFAETIGDFVTVIEGQLTIALTDIRAGEVETGEALDTLFATEPVNGRVSVARHGANLVKAEGQKRLWTLSGGLAGAVYVAASRRGVALQKQAIATINDRTTRTCLRVHGQIQDVDDPFELTEQPRYARRQQHPPFHDHCRTVEIPYIPEIEETGEGTATMRAKAIAERQRRDG